MTNHNSNGNMNCSAKVLGWLISLEMYLSKLQPLSQHWSKMYDKKINSILNTWLVEECRSTQSPLWSTSVIGWEIFWCYVGIYFGPVFYVLYFFARVKNYVLVSCHELTVESYNLLRKNVKLYYRHFRLELCYVICV